VEREYTLETEWRVLLEGLYVGSVTAVADGYQARTARDEPMYPHLSATDQHGIVHATVDGAAGELVTWARSQGGHDTVSFHRGTLEVAS